MLSEARKRTAQPWLPLALCAALAVIALVGEIAQSFITGEFPGGGNIVFISFLPGCFFFLGSFTAGMQREICELRQQVADMQSSQGNK